jgi:hypothetical protein
MIVVVAGAVERQLADEKPQVLVLQNGTDRFDRFLRVPSVGRYVNLPRAVVAHEHRHDLGELLAQERLSTRQVQVVHRAQIARQRLDLRKREVVALIQALPIEAMLALEIADGVDEQDQEGRGLLRNGSGRHLGQANVPRESGQCIGHVTDSTGSSSNRGAGRDWSSTQALYDTRLSTATYSVGWG